MGGLTEEQPKCLVELGGRPLLDWQVAALHGAGITDIAIVTGWRRELLEARASTTFHNPRWAVTNMVASLECAARWLEQDACVVSYSDIFYAPGAVSALLAVDADIALTHDPDWLALWSRRFPDPLSDAETFRTDMEGFVVDIGSRATSLEQIKGQYMGLLRFTPTGWKRVAAYRAAVQPDMADKMDMTSLLRGLIAQQMRIKAIPVSEPWGEVDTHSDLAVYAGDFARGRIQFPA